MLGDPPCILHASAQVRPRRRFRLAAAGAASYLPSPLWRRRPVGPNPLATLPLAAEPTPPRAPRLAVFTLVLVAVSGGALLFLAGLPSPWAEWRPATCMPSGCFCELPRPSAVRQPVNALSSLGFLLVASAVLVGAARAARSRSNAMSASPVYSRLYAAALVAIGLGSALFHASLTFVGQTADVMGMYLLGTFLVLYSWGRLRPLDPRGAAGWYVAANAVLVTLLVFAPALRRYAFAAIVVCALALELLVRRRHRVQARASLLGGAVIASLLGFGLWILDITGRWCDPGSVWQGHAAWHLCGAAAAASMFAYYLSEGPARS